MPSLTHQWLLLWLVRKMDAEGFTVSGLDGPVPQGGLWNDLPRPFDFGGVRPDACAVRPATGRVALGEAKTAADILTPHTQRQLQIFCGLLEHKSDRIECLYMAIPRTAAPALDRLLARMPTAAHVIRRIKRLHIPDCLLEGGW